MEWSRVAKPYEEAGVIYENAGRFEEARAAYLQAYLYYATGRYPVPHSAGKMECFRKSLELYEKAGRYFEPSLARGEIPYGEKTIPAYVRLGGQGLKNTRSLSTLAASTDSKRRPSSMKKRCIALG